MKEYRLRILVDEETEEVLSISEEFITSDKNQKDPFQYHANKQKPLKKKKDEILQSK